MNLNGNNIEAIIFDLGGVIININIEGTFKKLKSIGLGLDQDGLDIIKNNPIFQQFEIGRISPSEFRNEIRKISRNDFTDTEFDEIWNDMILDFPKENIGFLENIRSKYRIFLMSNTNQIHLEYFSKLLQKNFAYNNLGELFEKAYYSNITHLRKPNDNFFQLILSENKLKAQNTLFIDDFPENIVTAKNLGFNTMHFTNGKKLMELGIL